MTSIVFITKKQQHSIKVFKEFYLYLILSWKTQKLSQSFKLFIKFACIPNA